MPDKDTPNPYFVKQNPPNRFEKIGQEAGLPPLQETVKEMGIFISHLPSPLFPKFLSRSKVK